MMLASPMWKKRRPNATDGRCRQRPRGRGSPAAPGGAPRRSMTSIAPGGDDLPSGASDRGTRNPAGAAQARRGPFELQRVVEAALAEGEQPDSERDRREPEPAPARRRERSTRRPRRPQPQRSEGPPPVRPPDGGRPSASARPRRSRGRGQ